MKKQYIQPGTVAQTLQCMHFTCGSGNADIIFGNTSGDPNSMEIF